MGRLRQRIETAEHALQTLVELSSLQDVTNIVRDAAIQRFEYTFEAMWKATQLYLRDEEGLEIGSPKGAIRAALQVGLLNDTQTRLALNMADDRNLTVHTYNQTVAEAIFAHIPEYAHLMEEWLIEMRKRTELRWSLPN